MPMPQTIVVNGQQVPVLCYCGTTPTISLPTNNPNINLTDAGWQIEITAAPYDPQTGVGTFSDPYTAASSSDGSAALWTLTGTEFPGPTGGLFMLQFACHNTQTNQTFKDRLLVSVQDAN